MPSKQRFKPSRKPKPVEAPSGETQNVPPSETGNIDQATNPRRDENLGVIDAAGETP